MKTTRPGLRGMAGILLGFVAHVHAQRIQE